MRRDVGHVDRVPIAGVSTDEHTVLVMSTADARTLLCAAGWYSDQGGWARPTIDGTERAVTVRALGQTLRESAKRESVDTLEVKIQRLERENATLRAAPREIQDDLARRVEHLASELAALASFAKSSAGMAE